jgi:hypothetical protein
MERINRPTAITLFMLSPICFRGHEQSCNGVDSLSSGHVGAGFAGLLANAAGAMFVAYALPQKLPKMTYAGTTAS